MNETQIKELIKQKTANPPGRPSKYTQQLAEEILNRIACGESLMRICQDDHMPGYASVMRWQIKSTKFRENYVRARQQQAETYAESLIDYAMTEQDVNRARIVSDNIKWTASKLLPKMYGDKVTQDHHIDVTFNNAVPRPQVAKGHTTYSAGDVIEAEKVEKKTD